MLKGRVDKNAFSEAFKAKGIERSKDVETFLANMTGDDDGWVLPPFFFSPLVLLVPGLVFFFFFFLRHSWQTLSLIRMDGSLLLPFCSNTNVQNNLISFAYLLCCKGPFSLSIIHLFNWSALIDEDKDLGQVLQ